MESELQIAKARKVVRGLISRSHKRRPRIHLNAVENNLNRLRALEGLCGECANLELRFKHIDGKDRVTLFCKKGLDPLELYENTTLGESAECPEFKKVR